MIGLITGCVPRSIDPGAERVSVIGKSDIMHVKNCKFLQKISNCDVHGKKLQFTLGLEKNLLLDDIHFLKNEGKKFNANVVVLEEHKTFIERYSTNGNTDISSHSISANAYFCPTRDLADIRNLKNNLSTVYEIPVITKIY